jgi:hypothetical protein
VRYKERKKTQKHSWSEDRVKERERETNPRPKKTRMKMAKTPTRV